ncbi:MAG TPA: hypothetical protein VJT15_17230 [Pyrinomonadaceae bacterium]|nr:hypothetical protein [Pyrinomonadaceae bacterium]
MKELFLTLRSRFVSSIVISLTLIALCFSVGEGLRLTPFPVSRDAQLDPASSPKTTRSSQFYVQEYGPLAVPAQPQKRDKRFAIDLSGPVAAYSHELFTRRYSAFDYQPSTLVSALVVAFPSDRAPPLTA